MGFKAEFHGLLKGARIYYPPAGSLVRRLDVITIARLQMQRKRSEWMIR